MIFLALNCRHLKVLELDHASAIETDSIENVSQHGLKGIYYPKFISPPGQQIQFLALAFIFKRSRFLFSRWIYFTFSFWELSRSNKFQLFFNAPVSFMQYASYQYFFSISIELHTLLLNHTLIKPDGLSLIITRLESLNFLHLVVDATDCEYLDDSQDIDSYEQISECLMVRNRTSLVANFAKSGS